MYFHDGIKVSKDSVYYDILKKLEAKSIIGEEE